MEGPRAAGEARAWAESEGNGSDGGAARMSRGRGQRQRQRRTGEYSASTCRGSSMHIHIYTYLYIYIYIYICKYSASMRSAKHCQGAAHLAQVVRRDLRCLREDRIPEVQGHVPTAAVLAEV